MSTASAWGSDRIRIADAYPTGSATDRSVSLAPMKRVAIVGDSGSGKTWLAAELARRTGYPHIELDGLYWQEDWTPLAADELQAAVGNAIQAKRWIVDGNYGALVQPMVLEATDTVVWLDLPRWRVMTAITQRTLDRGLRRRHLWNGNRERLRNLLNWTPEENIIRWAWVQHPRYRKHYAALMLDPAHAHREWVRLRSRRAINDWLRRVAPQG